MLRFKLSTNIDKVVDGINKGLKRELVQGYTFASEYVAGKIRSEIASWPQSQTSKKTGALARSFRPILARDAVTNSGISGGVFSGLPYAGVQDHGGTIHAKRAANLTIPVSAAAKRKESASAFGGALFPIKRPGKPTLLAQKTGKRSIMVHYVLKPSVTLQGHHYIEKAREASADGVRSILSSAINRALSK